jgi:hypothetical protein
MMNLGSYAIYGYAPLHRVCDIDNEHKGPLFIYHDDTSGYTVTVCDKCLQGIREDLRELGWPEGISITGRSNE